MVSLYSPDAHSARAAHVVRRLNPVVLLTALGELELANALELLVFRKEATSTAIRVAQSRIQEHAQAGFFSVQAMPMTAYERAPANGTSAQCSARRSYARHLACNVRYSSED